MSEKCKVEGCNSPCESSTGFCHEHEIEARMKEDDEQQEFEESDEVYGDDEDEE